MSKKKASEQDVREKAYSLWEEAGNPPGDGKEFWDEAEKLMSPSQSSKSQKSK